METEFYKPEKPVEEQGVEIPLDALRPELLDLLIKDFILREGTDYGVEEIPLERKMDQLRKQLAKGHLKVIFDLSTETGSIVPVK